MINPVLASSARRRMRSARTPVLITLYCAAMTALVYFYSFQDFAGASITISQMGKGLQAYLLLIVLQFVLIVLVGPAMTAGSIAGERERQTLDLLRVTNTGSFSIVLGKLLESFGFLCLMILSSMPVLSLILVTGGVTLGQMLVSILFLLLIALVTVSVGLFASALFKRTVTATVVAYLLVFGLGIVTVIPIVWDVRQIGALYDESVNAVSAAMTSPDYSAISNYVPLSFVLNPGLGLLSLVCYQIQMEMSSLFGGYSHTLLVTSQYLRFDRYLWYHMIFLAGISVALNLLSVGFVRHDKHGRKANKRKKA